MKKKYIGWICGLLIVAVLAVSGLLLRAGADPVQFQDITLQSELQKLLNTDEITTVEMETLTDLDLSGKDITDLTGLDKAKNLKTLSLRNNRITDISAVSSLTALETLDVCGNQVTDLSALSGLNALRVLQITDNQVADLSPVSQLKMLQFLFCERNKLDLAADSGTSAMLAAIRARGTYVNTGDASAQIPDNGNTSSGDNGPTELAVSEGSALRLDREAGYLTGVQPDTAVSMLYEQLEYGTNTLRILDSTGISIDQTVIGTGMQVQLVNSRDKVLDSLTVLIYGDVNGDGSINVIDLAMLRKDIVSGGTLLNGATFDAGNLYAHMEHDTSDQTVDVIDLAVMRKSIVGDLTISQE